MEAGKKNKGKREKPAVRLRVREISVAATLVSRCVGMSRTVAVRAGDVVER